MPPSTSSPARTRKRSLPAAPVAEAPWTPAEDAALLAFVRRCTVLEVTLWASVSQSMARSGYIRPNPLPTFRKRAHYLVHGEDAAQSAEPINREPRREHHSSANDTTSRCRRVADADMREDNRSPVSVSNPLEDGHVEQKGTPERIGSEIDSPPLPEQPSPDVFSPSHHASAAPRDVEEPETLSTQGRRRDMEDVPAKVSGEQLTEPRTAEATAQQPVESRDLVGGEVTRDSSQKSVQRPSAHTPQQSLENRLDSRSRYIPIEPLVSATTASTNSQTDPHEGASHPEHATSERAPRYRWSDAEDALMLAFLARRSIRNPIMWEDVAQHMQSHGFSRNGTSCALRARRINRKLTKPSETSRPATKVPRIRTRPALLPKRSWTAEEEKVLLSCLARKEFDGGTWEDLTKWMEAGGHPRSCNACLQRTSKLRADAKAQGINWEELLTRHLAPLTMKHAEGIESRGQGLGNNKLQTKEINLSSRAHPKSSLQTAERGSLEDPRVLGAAQHERHLQSLRFRKRASSLQEKSWNDIAMVQKFEKRLGRHKDSLPREELKTGKPPGTPVSAPSKQRPLSTDGKNRMPIQGKTEMKHTAMTTESLFQPDSDFHKTPPVYKVAKCVKILPQIEAFHQGRKSVTESKTARTPLHRRIAKEAKEPNSLSEGLTKCDDNRVENGKLRSLDKGSFYPVLSYKASTACAEMNSSKNYEIDRYDLNRLWSEEEDNVLLAFVLDRERIHADWANVSIWMRAKSFSRSIIACKERAELLTTRARTTPMKPRKEGHSFHISTSQERKPSEIILEPPHILNPSSMLGATSGRPRSRGQGLYLENVHSMTAPSEVESHLQTKTSQNYRSTYSLYGKEKPADEGSNAHVPLSNKKAGRVELTECREAKSESSEGAKDASTEFYTLDCENSPQTQFVDVGRNEKAALAADRNLKPESSSQQQKSSSQSILHARRVAKPTRLRTYNVRKTAEIPRCPFNSREEAGKEAKTSTHGKTFNSKHLEEGKSEKVVASVGRAAKTENTSLRRKGSHKDTYHGNRVAEPSQLYRVVMGKTTGPTQCPRTGSMLMMEKENAQMGNQLQGGENSALSRLRTGILAKHTGVEHIRISKDADWLRNCSSSHTLGNNTVLSEKENIYLESKRQQKNEEKKDISSGGVHKIENVQDDLRAKHPSTSVAQEQSLHLETTDRAKIGCGKDFNEIHCCTKPGTGLQFESANKAIVSVSTRVRKAQEPVDGPKKDASKLSHISAKQKRPRLRTGQEKQETMCPKVSPKRSLPRESRPLRTDTDKCTSEIHVAESTRGKQSTELSRECVRTSGPIPLKRKRTSEKDKVLVKLRRRLPDEENMRMLRAAAIRRGVPVRPQHDDVGNPHSASIGRGARSAIMPPVEEILPASREEISSQSPVRGLGARRVTRTSIPASARVSSALRPWFPEEDRALLRLIAKRSVTGASWGDVVAWFEREGFCRTERAVQQRSKKLEKEVEAKGKVWLDYVREATENLNSGKRLVSRGNDCGADLGSGDDDQLMNCWYLSLSESEGSVMECKPVAPLGNM